jgi:peptidoglycan/xylan/chitin deacetylase (PgdA/CDA1 family)
LKLVIPDVSRQKRGDSFVVLGIVLAVVGLLALAHTAPFPFLLETGDRGLTVWRMPVSGSEKTIYLTFDDGPIPTATPDLLHLLKEKNVKATFFIIDEYVNAETAPIVRRMFEEGHSVGQHTGRRWLLMRSPAHVANFLRVSADKVERLTGRRPCRLFRPHAGWRSFAMFRGVARAGYRIIGWSWRSWDWVGFRERTAPRVAAQVIANAGPGKIVVIHDGHHQNPRANRQYAIEAAGRIIDELKARGYTFGTLCELASQR